MNKESENETRKTKNCDCDRPGITCDGRNNLQEEDKLGQDRWKLFGTSGCFTVNEIFFIFALR